MKQLVIIFSLLFLSISSLYSQSLEDKRKAEAYQVPFEFYIYYKELVDSYNSWKNYNNPSAPQIKDLVDRTLENSHNAYVYLMHPKKITKKSEIEKAQNLIYFLGIKKGMSPLEIFQRALRHFMTYKGINKDQMTRVQKEDYESFDRSFTSRGPLNTTYNEFFYQFLRSDQINALLMWR